jgi:UDP:flavonoid glycosyltransferase YjiC (YdhE family)
LLYRRAARAFQAEMEALPGPEQMVELLEALARAGAPKEP